MKENEIHRVLISLGCRHVRTRGDRVWSTCPFEYLHDGGFDKKPNSFKVEINDSGKSQYYCWACKETDSIEWLAYERGLANFTKEDLARLSEKNKQKSKKSYRKIRIDESRIDPYSGCYPKYIRNRGIDPVTAREWKIGYDKENARAIFPYWSIDGALRGVVGRSIRGQDPKYLSYYYDEEYKCFTTDFYSDSAVELKKGLYLYGEHLLEKNDMWLNDKRKDQNIVLVEGNIDVVWVNMALRGSSFCALGIQSSTMGEEQEHTITKNIGIGSKIVLMFDGDKAGMKATEDVFDRLGSRGYSVKDVGLKDGVDPNDIDLVTVRSMIREKALG